MIGRSTTPEFGVCSSADNPPLCHPQSLGYRLHHLWLLRRLRGDGRRRRGTDLACHRWRWLDPHSRGCQRPDRAEGLARRLFAGAADVRPLRVGFDPGLPAALVRDTKSSSTTAAAPDPANSCRSGRPPEPYSELIKRDPGRCASRCRTSGASIARRRRSSPSWSGSAISWKASATTWITRCRRSTIAPPSKHRRPATSAISPS